MEFVDILKKRFEKHRERHKNVEWEAVEKKLKAHPDAMKVLERMEATGGEPDVVDWGEEDALVFCDCSAESPKERRSLCYDKQAWDFRKEAKPKGNALDEAKKIGVELLTEKQYRALQTLGEFDVKSSSWILTPPEIRTHGGAIFADRRYNHVFVYHNGAESYYAARGFRGCVRI